MATLLAGAFVQRQFEETRRRRRTGDCELAADSCEEEREVSDCRAGIRPRKTTELWLPSFGGSVWLALAPPTLQWELLPRGRFS